MKQDVSDPARRHHHREPRPREMSDPLPQSLQQTRVRVERFRVPPTHLPRIKAILEIPTLRFSRARGAVISAFDRLIAARLVAACVALSATYVHGLVW